MPAEGTPWRRWLAPVVYGILGLALAAVIVFAATYNALDFRIYMWGGHAVLDDSRLYLAQAGGHWFTYSPFAAIVFVPVAALPLAVARAGWDLVSVAALAYSCTRILQIAGYRPTRITVAGFVAAAMALDPVWQTLFLGQINLILLALVTLDLALPDSCRWKGIGIGLAAGIKLTPLIFIPFLLGSRRIRAGVVSMWRRSPSRKSSMACWWASAEKPATVRSASARWSRIECSQA